MKFLKILGGIFSLLILTLIVWGALYLAIPNVKDFTDKNIFGVAQENVLEDEDIESDENLTLPDRVEPEPEVIPPTSEV